MGQMKETGGNALVFSKSLRALTQVMGVTCDLWNNLLIFMPLLSAGLVCSGAAGGATSPVRPFSAAAAAHVSRADV